MSGLASGFVLRRIPYTASMAIITIYTREFGLISCSVRVGGKRSQSGLFQPLQRLELEIDYRPGRQMQQVRRAGLMPGTAGAILTNPSRLAVLIFLSEVLFKVLKEEVADEGLFDFISSSLDYFDQDEFNPNFHLSFLLILTKFFGFYPNFQKNKQKPYLDLQAGIYVSSIHDSLHTADENTSKALLGLHERFSNEAGHFPMSHNERQNTLTTLLKYYQLHFEGFGELKSHPILMEVFSA